MHEVDAVAHDHAIPLRTRLVVHRLDLHALHDGTVFLPAIGDAAQTALRELFESVGHLEDLTVLAVRSEGAGRGGGGSGRRKLCVIWWRV